MVNARILLVEDDEIIRVPLYDRLKKCGWEVREAEDGARAGELINLNSFHLVLSDIRMPGMDGKRLLEKVKRISPETDVVLMTAYGGVEDAVECLKKGASDYVLKPFDMDDIVIRIKRLLDVQSIKERFLTLEEQCRESTNPIIGSSRKMAAVLNTISQVAMSDASVLITGESGTGKELVAAAIHYGSKRSDSQYVRVNCAAIPEGLIESELFGHEKGSFTGAATRKTGKFEKADGGTILLDEIGEVPMHLQSKLLRVLQEREIERVGGNKTIQINVRLLCATSRNLEQEVREGRFREDLYYRLKVIPVDVPPLRERKEDIPELCEYFVQKFCFDKRAPLRISQAAMDVLLQYDYPGNVRELKNIIERLTVLAPAPIIEPWHLPADITGEIQEESRDELTLSKAVARAEISCIRKALSKTGGNKTDAASLLGISRKNLWEKMKNLGIMT